MTRWAGASGIHEAQSALRRRRRRAERACAIVRAERVGAEEAPHQYGRSASTSIVMATSLPTMKPFGAREREVRGDAEVPPVDLGRGREAQLGLRHLARRQGAVEHRVEHDLPGDVADGEIAGDGPAIAGDVAHGRCCGT